MIIKFVEPAAVTEKPILPADLPARLIKKLLMTESVPEKNGDNASRKYTNN